MRRLALGLSIMGLLGGLLLLTRCFSPDLPECSFRCGPEEPRCPDEYECRDDGYCHRQGTISACPYSMDLAPAPDLRVVREGGLDDLQGGDGGTD